MNNGIEITPSVTVHELLKAYPEIEDVLIGIAPPFKKLKNPILKKTVAKVATIKHISSVGGVLLSDVKWLSFFHFLALFFPVNKKNGV